MRRQSNPARKMPRLEHIIGMDETSYLLAGIALLIAILRIA